MTTATTTTMMIATTIGKGDSMHSSQTTNGKSEVLTQFDQHRAILTATRVDYPALLKRQTELSKSTGDDKRLAVEAEENGRARAACLRKRGIAIEAVLALQPELEAERDRVQPELGPSCADAKKKLYARHDAAVLALLTVREELHALGAVMGENIVPPMPVRRVPRLDGLPDDIVAERIDHKAKLDPEVQKLLDHLAVIDSALTLLSNIYKSRRFDVEEAVNSRGGAGAPGAYMLLRPVVCLLDLETYAEGEYVDAELIGAGSMVRSLKWRGTVRAVA
jgi:hypothetical protein